MEKAVLAVPTAQILWLMWAKERWLAGDVNGSRSVLQESFQVNPNSEDIWLAAYKLEAENGELDRAKILLAKAREKADTPRVWMKSAVFERQQGHWEAALALAQEGLSKFNDFDKLHMIRYDVHVP